ncbi:MAG: hypothetical protein GY698_05540 [Actinomycetia bacterium]|nr:hypothetical protein [Actinomycetes bacterium]
MITKHTNMKWTGRRRGLALLLTAAGLVVACSSGSSGDGDASPEEPVGVVPAAELAAESVPSSPMITGFAATPFEGVPTFADVEAGFYAAIDCMESAGVEVTEAELDPAGKVGLGISAVTPELLDAAEIIRDKCRAEHFDDVSSKWDLENAPSQTEVAESFERMRQCLIDSDPSLDGLTFEEAVAGAHPLEAERCDRQADNS